jgi:NADP-dependent 3-hydroxy acid dehydrogenase YdfG
MQLSSLKIIVTGAAQGMGAHFARRLAEAGAQVAAGDVLEEGLAQLAESTRGLPGKVHTRKLDVSNEAEVGSFVDWAYGAMGGLNGLVNNAGILRDGLLVKKDKTTGEVTRLGRDKWDAVIGVNLTGATMMVRDVVAKMVSAEQKPGVIVNMSSIARHGNRGQSNYGEHADVVARVRCVRRPRRRGGARHDRNTDDAGHEPEGARCTRREHSGRPHRRARGHLARREVRARVRLLQWAHHRRRWWPRDVA